MAWEGYIWHERGMAWEGCGMRGVWHGRGVAREEVWHERGMAWEGCGMRGGVA